MNRKPSISYHHCLALLIAAVCLIVTRLSAAPTMTAAVEPTEIRPGGFANYSITIDGGQPDDVSDLKLPAGVELANPTPSFSNQITIINGVTKSSGVLSWQITSNEGGEHIIPPQEMHVGGVPYKTNETKLIVKDNPNSATSAYDPLLTIEVAKKQIYVGEVVPVIVNLYVHRRTMLRRVGLIEVPKDNFAIQRFPLQAEESVISMGGISYRALAFRSTLSALKPGKFKLGPAGTEIILEVPSQGNGNSGGFMSPFFNQSEARKLRPSCNEIELTVLPLPEADKPKNFTGIVGDFKMSLTADPKAVNVGDPISAEVNITGSGNFDTLSAPTLTHAEDWKTYPAKRINLDPNTGVPNVEIERHIAFNQVIIPKKPVKEIPSFEFSFFSATEKKYVTLRTEPIPITVKATEASAELAHEKASTNTLPPPPDEPEKVQSPKPKITDILTVTPTQAHWLIAQPSVWKDEPFFKLNIALLGIFSLLVFGKIGQAVIASRLASGNVPTNQLWKNLNKSDLPRAEFYHLAANYLSAKNVKATEATPEIQDIISKDYTLNYGRPTKEASESISNEEQSKAIAVLKTLA
jgi:hypothetical protein